MSLKIYLFNPLEDNNMSTFKYLIHVKEAGSVLKLKQTRLTPATALKLNRIKTLAGAQNKIRN